MTPVLRAGLLALILCGVVSGGHARVRGRLPLGMDGSLLVQLGGSYVDNVVRLSEADIDRFQHNVSPFQTPLETYDDWKSELVLRPRLKLRLPQRHSLVAIYSFKAAEYWRNDFLDYQTHTLNLYLRPVSSRNRWLLNLRVFSIPSYYLRSHYDRDTGAFHAARFQNWQYRVAPRFRFWRPLWIELRGEFETTYYNAKFTEYDSEMNNLGMGAEYRGWRPVTFALHYYRNRSINVGHRQTGGLGLGLLDLPGIEAEYGDASFDEDEFVARVSARVATLAHIAIRGALSCRFRRRVYTTGNSLEEDPFHRGRLDTRVKVSPSLTAVLTTKASLTVGYSHEVRQTVSDIPRVEQIKGFRVRQIHLTLQYKLL